MKRRTYEHKMFNLMRVISEDANKTRADRDKLRLGKAMRHLHYSDLSEALEKCGSYEAIWETLSELRRIYGVK